jgi:anti-anti-sigma regulatory factor
VSTTTTIQAHIAYELIDDDNPEMVVIQFLSHEIADPGNARALGEQLHSLIRPDLPQNYVIDFSNVRSLGSSAFGEIVSFVRDVGWVWVCNMQDHLRLGASLIGLDDCADFAASRKSAINKAQYAARHHEEDTVDYPASWLEFNN